MEKILIVDDSATDRLIIKSLLDGYEVITASNGLEALEQLNLNPDVELVILDLNMPHMDGFQVLETFKRESKYSHIHTIIFTNLNEPDNEIKGLRLGAFDYIRKPIQRDSFKARIEVHLELLRVQRILRQKLYDSNATINTILDQAPVGITISHNRDPYMGQDTDGILINKEFERLTGRSRDELIKTGWAQITHPDDLEEVTSNYNKYLAGENKSYSMIKRYIKPDGSITWANIIVAPLNLIWNRKYRYILLATDITSQKEAETALIEIERSKSVLLSNIPGLAYRCKYDREWTMLYVSPGCYNLTGYHPESLLLNRDVAYNDLISPEYQDAIRKKWEKVLSKKTTFRYEYEIITAKGQRKWVLESGQGVYKEDGQVEALEGIILDISEKKKFENQLKYNSDHEFETGLYNHKYFVGFLEQEDLKNRSLNQAFICLNLSSVHLLSLTYGFQYSQKLIKKVSKALQKYCGKINSLFYIYEYHFVIYIKGYQDKSSLENYCKKLVNILESLILPERISTGLGVVEINNDNLEKNTLIKNLLIASEKAVQAYSSSIGICYFNKNMQEQIQREEDIKFELAQTIEEEKPDRLFLVYQPIWEISSDKICGFEALARLESTKYGLVHPLEFIPLAERSNLIIPLGHIIIRKALNFLKTLKENDCESVAVSINISMIQLLDDNFIPSLLNEIEEKQINPANVVLEITESIFDANYKKLNTLLAKLTIRGIRIAIDDFGTGYSSLAKQKQLKVNCLKIDKFFIDKLLEINPDEAITGDIISMGHKLGHTIIAEGVEDESQLSYLRDKGCDMIQGYLISKPLTEEDALKMIRDQEDTTYKI